MAKVAVVPLALVTLAHRHHHHVSHRQDCQVSPGPGSGPAAPQ